MTDAQRNAMSFPMPATDKGRLIVIDAIDGAGKNMVADALKRVLTNSGRKIVDLDAIAKATPTLLYDEGTSERFAGCNVMFVSQPTHVGIGRVIREEIMRDHGAWRAYDARSLAQAFALDREVLYRRTILPFLQGKPGRLVVQVRGLLSTLVHQTLAMGAHNAPLTVSELLELPGNRLELSRRPDLILLLMISPETAKKRLQLRTEKVDGDIFADQAFQACVSLRYRDEDVRAPFKRLGTAFVDVDVDANATKQEVATKCFHALRPFLDT